VASHLYWALWSIVMGVGKAQKGQAPPAPEAAAVAGDGAGGQGGGMIASGPPPSYSLDYAVYGLDRAEEYLRLKGEVLEGR
jgi:hypothetical protein